MPVISVSCQVITTYFNNIIVVIKDIRVINENLLNVYKMFSHFQMRRQRLCCERLMHSLNQTFSIKVKIE